MEKAKLTQGAAAALELRKEEHKNDLSYAIMIHVQNSYGDDCYLPLNDLDNETFCRAILGDYEVIEEDQVVTVTNTQRSALMFARNESYSFESTQESIAYKRGFDAVINISGIKL